MKAVQLIVGDKFSSERVLREMLESGVPSKGMSLGDMRRRLRVLDALDTASDGRLVIEDADHTMLVEMIDGFAFAVAHRDLVAICEAVQKATDAAARNRDAA